LLSSSSSTSHHSCSLSSLVSFSFHIILPLKGSAKNNILKANQILLLKDPKKYIIDMFINVCILNYKSKKEGLTAEESDKAITLLDTITNVLGRQSQLIDECITIFSTSMNMRNNIYESWDLVEDYLKDRINI